MAVGEAYVEAGVPLEFFGFLGGVQAMGEEGFDASFTEEFEGSGLEIVGEWFRGEKSVAGVDKGYFELRVN